MATVTYGGPRPEINVHLEYPIGYRWRMRNGMMTSRDTEALEKKKVRIHSIEITTGGVVVEPLVAVCLALLRRWPRPWFRVKMKPGEWAEALAMVKDGTGMSRVPVHGFLDYIGWSDYAMHERLAEQEKKPMFNENGLVWAPAGWRATTAR